MSYGSDQVFTITPDAGYQVADVLVDGASVGAVTSYTFSVVTADHSIEACFSVVPVPEPLPCGPGAGAGVLMLGLSLGLLSCVGSGMRRLRKRGRG